MKRFTKEPRSTRLSRARLASLRGQLGKNLSNYNIGFHNLEGFDHAIWVLIWKHLIERKRCFCDTIWQIMSGVLVFAVFFLLSQTLRYDADNTGSSTVVLYPNDVHISNVFYSPNHTFNQLLMNRVAEKIKEHSLSNETVIIRGFRSNDDVYDVAKLLDPRGIVVINFESDPISSNKFKYSMGKVKPEENNQLYLMLDGYINVGAVDDDSSQSLAQLQWAIDSSYMEQLSDHQISHDIQLQTPSPEVSKELHIIHGFLILCTIVAPMPFFLYNSSRLIIERRSGLKELMKMLRVSPNVLRCSHLIDTGIIGIVYSGLITLFLKVTTRPILPHSNALIIAITIILHFLNTTSLAFITSALSQDLNHADSLAMLTYMCTFMLGFIWYDNVESQSKWLIYFMCCVLPHAPIYIFWDEVRTLEMYGEGVSFFKLFSALKDNSIAVGFLWLLSLFHLALIMVVAWYCDLIRPGRYGIPKKWGFIFQSSFWSPPRKVTFDVTSEKVVMTKDDRFFEKPLKGVDVAIKIVDVTKIFRLSGKSEVLALDNINLDIYKGEVTVLLGANGAGKSTLLYIITGMYSSTKGTVYINGLDLSYRIQELRKDFGLCPQNNVTFEYLTVRENIRFFEMLKSVDEPLRSKADLLMKQLKLIDKADYFSRQLSTGKKRCLQVACALAGASDVLVLDEPTAGMDPESRHCFWDIIMELRGSRTVLMATSCLEEADALGDRVALLNAGKLRCHGSPCFLKRAIDAGFNLSITLKHRRNADDLKGLVEETVPHSTYKMYENKRILFNLPSTMHERFPILFDLLEEKKEELGISLIEVGMFMEEIFLGFIEEEKDNDITIDCSLHNMHDERLQGICLIMQQLRVLLARSFIYMWRKKTQFIILQIILPIVSIIVSTVTSNSKLGYGNMHDDNAGNIVKLTYNTGPYRRSGLLDNLNLTDPKIRTVYSKDMHKAYHGPQTVGFDMNENNSTIYFPVDSQAVVTKAVNLFSNIFMAVHMPYVVNHSIETKYDGIEMRASQGVVKPKHLVLCMEWAMWIVFLAVFPLVPHVLLSIREHLIGTRHNHYTTGCSPAVHWTSKLVAHTTVYILIIPVAVLATAYLLEFDNTLNQLSFLGCLLAMLAVFGPAFLTHIYVLSFFLKINHAISVIYIMTLVFGVVVPIFLYVFSHINSTSHWFNVPHIILTVLAYGSPVYTFSVGLCRLTITARLNAYCTLNKHLCPNLTVDDWMFDGAECCESPTSTPYGYLVSFNSGLLDLALLVVHFIVNFAIVIIIEYKVGPNLLSWLLNYSYKEPEQFYCDPTVLKEIKYVQKKIKDNDFEEDALLACNLHKHFFVSYKKLNNSRYIFPVRGVSFSAKYGECICILGPNGVGKSALLLMLAGYISMTRGDICVGGTCIRRNRSQYLRKIDLISSTTGLDGFLSGQQNLILFARLQGYSEHACKTIARQMLAFMGLQSYCDTHVRKYSVGCSRRLALCASMVMCPKVVLLEQPMTMVDPYSRPLVVRALKRMLKESAAVIVTETNFEKTHMELIYDRVAIMFRGQIAALGSSDEVKASLVTGFSVRIKLRMMPAYEITSVAKQSPIALLARSAFSVENDVEKIRKLLGDTEKEDEAEEKDEVEEKEEAEEKDEREDKDEAEEKEEAEEKDEVEEKEEAEEKDEVEDKDEAEEKEEAEEKDEAKEKDEATEKDEAKDAKLMSEKDDMLDLDTVRRLRMTSTVYRDDVRDLKIDMEETFPNSELTNEHLSMLYYYIKDFEKQLQYSQLFTQLEALKERYEDLIEDYTLSAVTVEEVYRTLDREQHLKRVVIRTSDAFE